MKYERSAGYRSLSLMEGVLTISGFLPGLVWMAGLFNK
ncbi:MAG: hypothetical protein JWQ44_445 [Chthoniobacter sp.]|jgi:hypothetical protein|nr:hypothetical protein [Chthoniobacter sp.]